MIFSKLFLVFICGFSFLYLAGCSTNNNESSSSSSTTSISTASNPTTSLEVQSTSTNPTTTSVVETQELENTEEELNRDDVEEKDSFNPDEAPEGEDFEFTEFEARDPELVFDESTAYLYTTNIFAVWGEPINLPIWRTENFTDYEFLGDGLEDLGVWAEDSWTWAPGVIKINPNKWIVFYTARVAGTTDDPAYPAGVQCIGKAISSGPGTLYTDSSFIDSSEVPFICQESLGGSIDASPFRDEDGSLWLVWKADTNAPHIAGTACLYAQKLSPNGENLLGSPTNILCKDQSWEEPLIENPDFFRDGVGDLWLSYSAGWWDSDSYSTGLASCASPLGPCEKEGQWLSSGDGLVGPGGVTFASDGEDDYIVVCSWEGGAGFDEGGTGVTGVVQMARVISHIRSDEDVTVTLDGRCYTTPPITEETTTGEINLELEPITSVQELARPALQLERRIDLGDRGQLDQSDLSETPGSSLQPELIQPGDNLFDEDDESETPGSSLQPELIQPGDNLFENPRNLTPP